MDLSNKELKRWLRHLTVQLDIRCQMDDLRASGLSEEEIEGYVEFYWEGWYGDDSDLGVSKTMWRKDN